ncbi:MAG: MBL fold metallo-hydrolase [Phascolarctobacterium sp.]|nr:MBL fold metallo-hydrolase [Phascolarctobacterium sp.]
MRRIKLIVQMLVAFIIATLAFSIFYEPHQESVRAQVKRQLSWVKQTASEVQGKKSTAASVETTTSATVPTGQLKITLLDVGQADAILLQDGKRNIMIDVGDSRKDKLGYGGRQALARSLAAAGVREGVDRINTVIITHHHGDHLGNIKWMAGKYRISNIYDNAMPNLNNMTSSWLNTELRAGHYHNRVLQAGDRVDFDKGYYLEVLAPGDFIPKAEYKNLNNTSIVMKLHYGSFTMLLTGDAEAPVEDLLQQRYGSALKADVLKVGHHGSRTSSIWRFVHEVKPKYALISCGPFEIYHHPNKDVLGRLEHLGARVLSTFDHGNIVVTTDGKKFSVATEK